MYRQLQKMAGLYFPDHVGSDVSGEVGYHGTSSEVAKSVLEKGFELSFIHPETFVRDYGNFLGMMPEGFQTKMFNMEDEFVPEEERAEILYNEWHKKFGGGTVIWLGDLVTASGYGDVMFKVTLPEGSIDMGSDWSGGSSYYVPMSPIPPEYFEVIEDVEATPEDS